MSDQHIDPWLMEVHHPFVNDELVPLLADYLRRSGYPAGSAVAATFMCMVTSAYACGLPYTELQRMLAFAWQCADQAAEESDGRTLQ